MSDENNNYIDASLKTLSILLGKWNGKGQGDFPTIDPFTFDEEIVFTANGVEPLIHYEQKTWDTTHRKDHAEPLHWESGFIRPVEAGVIEISNVQNNGRVEVLSGNLTTSGSQSTAFYLSLTSVLVMHDPRMRHTTRRYDVAGGELNYQIHMATQNNTNLTPHIQACLRKSE